MFLALRELKHSWLRYLLIGAVMALIAWLVFLLTGLASGLAQDNAGAMVNMDADYLAYSDDAEESPHRSNLAMSTLETIKALDGVEAVAPIGHMTVTLVQLNGGENIDATIFGTDASSFVVPKIVEGRNFDPEKNEVVLNETATKDGVALGDEVQVLLSDKVFKVVGFVRGHTYSHLPVMFMSIPNWQSLKFVTEASTEAYPNPISLVAIKMDKDTAAKVEGAVEGVDILSHKEAIATVPGYKEESGTIDMIQGFLLVIAALIMTVFFYVLTMQKTSQFGIMKAIGASTFFLVKDLVIQVILLSIAGILFGAFLTFTVASVIPADVPFALEPSLIVIYGAILLVVAIVGTNLSLWNISRIDPLIAIGRND